jgi:hypothetical protein
MSDFELAITIILFLIGLYVFIRNVFGLSHKATILNIIIAAITGFIAVGQDKRGKKED